MNKDRAIWFTIFVAGALIGLTSLWLPNPPSKSPATEFGAARAFEHIRSIAKAPHPTGSPENARVRQYLFETLRELGLNPREMKGAPNNVPIVNLYSELEGTNKSLPPVLLVAHYDTTPRGPGAADDSTGVAVALETIRALKATGAHQNSIGVLLTDGEEVHGVCLGAYHFVHTETNLMSALRVVVNLEARGDHGPVLMFQTGRDNNGLMRIFQGACPLPVAASFSEEVYRRMPNDTDLTEFLNAGKRGYNFAFTGGLEFYHTAQDTPENLSQRTLQHYGACVQPLVSKLADLQDAKFADALQPGDATFFALCRGVLIRYPASFAKILSFVTVVFAALALIHRRKNLRARNLLLNVGVNLLAITVSVAIALTALIALKRIYKATGAGPFIIGIPHGQFFHIALVILAFLATFILRARLLRRTGASDQLAASILLWLALALAVDSLLPGAAYLFVWPALLAAVALGIARFETILTAFPAPLLIAPTLVLLHHTITLGITPLSAALVSTSICLYRPTAPHQA